MGFLPDNQKEQATPTPVPIYRAREAARSCVCCGKELTDAASVETGIGPICRKRTNAALAVLLPANFDAAFALVGESRALLMKASPDVLPALGRVFTAILADPAAARVRKDWRELIGDCAFVLSHEHVGYQVRTFLYTLAEFLGYAATVALWRGEVVLGAVTLQWVPAQYTMVLKCPRPPKEVRDALYKMGFMYYASEDKTLRIVIRSQERLDEVKRTMQITFCTWTDSVAIALEEAHTTLQVSPPPASSIAPVKNPASAGAVAVIETVTSYVICMPYNAAFVQRLRQQVPADAKRWDHADKSWTLRKAAVSAENLLDWIETFYGVRPVITQKD